MKTSKNEITIREATTNDAQSIAMVHTESWRVTYKNILEESFLSSLQWENRVMRWKHILDEETTMNCYVAEIKGNVVGFITGGKCLSLGEFDAELYSVYILEKFQGIGIGTKLFEKIKNKLIDQGFHSLITWVAEENPYKKFYQDMGAKLTPQVKVEKIGSREIRVVAYAWANLIH